MASVPLPREKALSRQEAFKKPRPHEEQTLALPLSRPAPSRERERRGRGERERGTRKGGGRKNHTRMKTNVPPPPPFKQNTWINGFLSKKGDNIFSLTLVTLCSPILSKSLFSDVK